MTEPVYRRVVIKLSGEASRGTARFRHRSTDHRPIAADLIAARQLGIELGVVVGGGNIFRGVEVSSRGVSRPTGDTMGMLATVMNCLVLEAAIERKGAPARTLSAFVDAGGLRDFYPYRGAQIPRRGPDRAARRRNRQSVLHHRHDRRAARR